MWLEIHRLSGILRRVLPLWRLLYQASFRWQSLRWALSSANEVKKFVLESERCPEDGYQKCEKLVTCIHQEAESNEQNELNQVEVAPHQNGKSDMSDVDLVGHTETWCSTVNLASFLGCLKTTLWHLETVSLVYWSCWGCGNVRREILFSWFRSYALWDVGLWNILSVTGDVMKAIHCGSLCASLCLHAAASSHRSDHMGMMWGSLSRKICWYASLDAWLHETPWGLLNTRKHPATSSHSCSCLPRPRKESDGDSALQDWRDVSMQPVFDCKKPISEALVLCLGLYLPKSLESLEVEIRKGLSMSSCARFQDWLSSLAEENFSKAPGVGSIFGNPSQGLAGVGPTEATTTWYVVGMIYVLDGYSMIFRIFQLNNFQSFSRWLSLLHLHLHQRLLLRRPFLWNSCFCFFGKDNTETGRFTQISGTCSPLFYLVLDKW